MAKVQALRSMPLSSPERDAFRQAVAARAEAAADLARGEEALRQGREEKAQAAAELARLGEAVVDVRKEDARRCIEARRAGQRWSPGKKLTELRLEENTAAAVCEYTDSELVKLESNLGRARRVLTETGERLAAAADAVLAAEIPSLLKEAETLQSQLVDRRLALRFILSVATPWSQRDASPEVTAALKLLEADLPGSPAVATYKDWDSDPRLAAWREWREALMRGIDAEPPT